MAGLNFIRFLLVVSFLVAVTADARAQVNSRGWKIWKTQWSESDLNKYSEFVQALGESGCRSINSCLKNAANPYRGTDRANDSFRSDCADLPYTLMGYFAWKNGLPFVYSSAMKARGGSGDIRYSKDGNYVSARLDLTSAKLGDQPGVKILNTLVDYVSTAMFRTGPDLDVVMTSDGRGVGPDFYPVAVSKGAIRPGTAFYDPSGHVAVVYKIGSDGRVYMMDAHPDQSITRIMFGEKFSNSRASHGSGFKNFRPMKLVGAQKSADGSWVGGRMVSLANAELADYSTEQYVNSNWKAKKWTQNGVLTDFYSYTRLKLAAGSLRFNPVEEMRSMMAGMCSDFQDRVISIQIAVQKGIDAQSNPERLPVNIYGTSGDWEEYSTPSRDARLKTAAVELRTTMESLVGRFRANDPLVVYHGKDLKGDLLRTYREESQKCSITYVNSRGGEVRLGYDHLMARLFKMSFDPYHCAELRWGAAIGSQEFAGCRDSAWDLDWYKAEQRLRNQIERTYDARMDFTLQGLRSRAPGSGQDEAPDVDLKGYLERM
ncbi:MAG: hypothetical protein KF789_09175 [Bdellovibrionaceae bacterium]|nr:hypothetical protein [Pseudobdellovibrionaceae bacterium]